MPSHTAFYTSGCFTITSLIAREKLAMNMYLVDMSSRVNGLPIPHFAHARYSTSQRYPTSIPLSDCPVFSEQTPTTNTTKIFIGKISRFGCDFIDKRVFFTPASEVTACDYYYLAAQACIESVHY